jgi:hypothetical protein
MQILSHRIVSPLLVDMLEDQLLPVEGSNEEHIYFMNVST